MDELINWLKQEDNTPFYMKIGRTRHSFVLIKIQKSARAVLLFAQKNRLDHSISGSDFSFAGIFLPLEERIYALSRDFRRALQTTYSPSREELYSTSSDQLFSRIHQQTSRRIEEIVADSPENLSIQQLKNESYIYELARLDNPELLLQQAIRCFELEEPMRYLSNYSIKRRNLPMVMEYIEDPDSFVQNQALAYIKDNEEEILYELLRNARINGEYDRLQARKDFELPIAANFKALLEECGCELAEVEIFKNARSMKFDMPVSAFDGKRWHYSADLIQAPDSRSYLLAFGNVDFYPGEITSLSIKGQKIYAKPDQNIMPEIPNLPEETDRRPERIKPDVDETALFEEAIHTLEEEITENQ